MRDCRAMARGKPWPRAGNPVWRIIAAIMPRTNQLSPGAAHLVGLLFIASGAFPMLAAFGVGPLRAEDINGPPWLGLAAGGCFVAAGCAIIAGPQSPLPARLFGILSLLGLALVGNWVAFGVGERICGGSFSLAWIGGGGDLGGLACRIPFGVGALITDAFLCLMLARTLQQALGGPPRLARLVKGAEWLILASLLPILLPLALFVLTGAAFGALKTRILTGAWPRNEEFIARQKAKGLLGKFGAGRPESKP